jgi:carbon storage regulator
MLVLSRMKDESVMIGHHLLVTVSELDVARVELLVSRKTRGGRMSFFTEIARTWLDLDASIPLGEGISCLVVDVRGDKVRLGFTYPKEISLHRKEVYDALNRENDVP